MQTSRPTKEPNLLPKVAKLVRFCSRTHRSKRKPMQNRAAFVLLYRNPFRFLAFRVQSFP